MQDVRAESRRDGGTLGWIAAQVAERPGSYIADILWGVGAFAAAAVLRIAFETFLGDRVPFITFFPAMVVATLFGGVRGGLVCLVGGLAFSWYFLLSPPNHWVRAPVEVALVPVFLFFGGLIIVVMTLFRRALREVGRLQAQERFLAEELRHRIKNTLTVVQAISSQTMRRTGGGPDFEKAFNERIGALARASERLGADRAGAIALDALAREALAPFDNGRLTIEGEAVVVAADRALALGLCLHELATNAVKYGALSVPDGRVEIRWTREGATKVSLVWLERDGPSVSPPTRSGFGDRLLRNVMSAWCDTPVRLEFESAGVQWEARFTPA